MFCVGNGVLPWPQQAPHAGAILVYWRWFVLGCRDDLASQQKRTPGVQQQQAVLYVHLTSGLTACSLFYWHYCCIDLLWHHPGISSWNRLECSPSRSFHPCNAHVINQAKPPPGFNAHLILFQAPTKAPAVYAVTHLQELARDHCWSFNLPDHWACLLSYATDQMFVSGPGYFQPFGFPAGFVPFSHQLEEDLYAPRRSACGTTQRTW